MFSSEHCLGLVASLGNMIDSALTDCADQKVESGLTSDAAEVFWDFRMQECGALTECDGKRCVVTAPNLVWTQPYTFSVPWLSLPAFTFTFTQGHSNHYRSKGERLFSTRTTFIELFIILLHIMLFFLAAKEPNHQKQQHYGTKGLTQVLLKWSTPYSIRINSLSCHAWVELTQNDPQSSTG